MRSLTHVIALAALLCPLPAIAQQQPSGAPTARLSSAILWTVARQSPLKLQQCCSMEPCRATGSWCSRGETTV